MVCKGSDRHCGRSGNPLAAMEVWIGFRLLVRYGGQIVAALLAKTARRSLYPRYRQAQINSTRKITAKT